MGANIFNNFFGRGGNTFDDYSGFLRFAVE
jgi:hypothetical protein